MQRRSTRIVHVPGPQHAKKPFGRAQRVSTYCAISAASFDELATAVSKAMIENPGLAPYGSPLVLGATVGQMCATWR